MVQYCVEIPAQKYLKPTCNLVGQCGLTTLAGFGGGGTANYFGNTSVSVTGGSNRLLALPALGFQTFNGDDSGAGVTFGQDWITYDATFYARSVFGFTALPNNSRFFAGLKAGNEYASNTTYLTKTDICGMGFLSASSPTNMFLVHNDQSGNVNTVDLGIAVATNVAYMSELWAFDDTEIFYRLTQLDAQTIEEGSITTQLPANNTTLQYQVNIGNGVNAPDAPASFRLSSIYTDWADILT